MASHRELLSPTGQFRRSIDKSVLAHLGSKRSVLSLDSSGAVKGR